MQAQTLWDKNPEIQLKKSKPAPYTGVLMPEQNYRNYKTFEESNEALMQKVEGSKSILSCPDCDCINPVLYGIVFVGLGFVAGSLVFHH